MDKLDTLKPGNFISSSVVDFYLFNQWFHARETSPYYFLPSFSLTSDHPLDAAFSEQMWSVLASSADDMVPIKNVFSWLGNETEKTIIVFDFQHSLITKIQSGTTISQVDEWLNQIGYGYWGIIATIFGWDPTGNVTCEVKNLSLKPMASFYLLSYKLNYMMIL